MYKLIGEDENSFTLHGPAGRMRIAKNGLSSQLSQRIQNMASGGIVDQAEQDMNARDQKSRDDFMNTMSGVFKDTGRTASSPAEFLDSYLGAPVRTAMGEIEKGNYGTDMLKKSFSQMGKDPQTAPTGFDIASKMTDNPYLGTALATGADLAQIPIGELAGLGRVLPGVVGEVRKIPNTNIIDAGEEFLNKSGDAIQTAANRMFPGAPPNEALAKMNQALQSGAVKDIDLANPIDRLHGNLDNPLSPLSSVEGKKPVDLYLKNRIKDLEEGFKNGKIENSIGRAAEIYKNAGIDVDPKELLNKYSSIIEDNIKNGKKFNPYDLNDFYESVPGAKAEQVRLQKLANSVDRKNMKAVRSLRDQIIDKGKELDALQRPPTPEEMSQYRDLWKQYSDNPNSGRLRSNYDNPMIRPNQVEWGELKQFPEVPQTPVDPQNLPQNPELLDPANLYKKMQSLNDQAAPLHKAWKESDTPDLDFLLSSRDVKNKARSIAKFLNRTTNMSLRGGQKYAHGGVVKGYQVKHEDENHFLVAHPDGSHFKVAKSGLSPETLQKISQMKAQYLADGGEVADPQASEDISIFPPDHIDPPPNLTEGFFPGAHLYETSTVPEDTTFHATHRQPIVLEEPAQAQVPQTQPQSPAQASNFNPESVVNRAFAPLSAGINKQADVQAQMADEQLKAQQEYQRQLEANYQEYQKHVQSLDQEHTELMNQVKNQTVDPHRMWNSMSEGNRTKATLALALGGFGQGLVGGSNPALDMINKSIDRDIEAQRFNASKTNNLLNINMQRYHNMEVAQMATKAQMLSVLQAQTAQIAARHGGDLAKAQALQLQGQLNLQKLPLMQQIAQYQFNSAVQGQGTQGGLPESQVPPMAWMEKDHNLVKVTNPNGEGIVYRAVNPDAAKKMTEFEPIAGGVASLMQQLDNIGPSALVPGSYASNLAQAIRAQLHTKIPQLRSVEIGGKRVNETEAEAADQAISDPTSFKQLLNSGVRSNNFFKNLLDEVEMQRRQNYIGYRGMFKPKTAVPYRVK